jgi:hypothetical protein
MLGRDCSVISFGRHVRGGNHTTKKKKNNNETSDIYIVSENPTWTPSIFYDTGLVVALHHLFGKATVCHSAEFSSGLSECSTIRQRHGISIVSQQTKQQLFKKEQEQQQQ